MEDEMFPEQKTSPEEGSDKSFHHLQVIVVHY